MLTVTVLALLIATASPPIDGLPPDAVQLIADLQQQVQGLQRQVDDLAARDDASWLTQQRADQIRAVVHDVLADADTRASLLQSGATAGWDGGFFLASADGNFTLSISGYIQPRFVFNHQDGEAVDENRWGFDIRRTRIKLAGTIVDPSWQYTVQPSIERTGETTLADVFIRKDLGDGWALTLGQFKVPFTREELVSATRQLAADRSLINAEFTGVRSQGVSLGYEGGRWRATAMLHDGLRGENMSWSVEDTEVALSGRVEFLLEGDFKTFDDFTSPPGGVTGVMLGAAAHYQKDEFGTGANLPSPDFNNAEVEQVALTADASVELGGANLFAALIYRNLDSVAMSARDQIGIVAQGGVYIAETWELFARYEHGDFDLAGIEDLNVITVGLNKHFSGHALKWTGDLGYAFDPVDAVWASDGAGWRADEPGEDGQIVVRSQFQLMF